MKKWLTILALVIASGSPIGAEQKASSHPSLITGLSLEVFFPPTDPRHPDYEDVHKYLLSKSSPAFPLISGAVIRVEWSDFDFGDKSSGTHTKYDFKAIDEMIEPWISAGKTANLVLHAVPYGAPPKCPEHGSGSNGESGTGNCAMPAWMWTALGESNSVTCDGARTPNFFASAYITNYQNAIAALAKHYADNPDVAYIRAGLGKGGEINLPRGWHDAGEPCGDAYIKRWGYTAGDSEKYTWNAYLKKMLEFEGTINHYKQLMTSLTPVQAPGADPAAVSDFIAPIAAKNGIGIGDEGLSDQSIRNCGGMQVNWCSQFERYHGKIPLELQTLGRSCPQGVNACDEEGGHERRQNQNRPMRGPGGFGQRRFPGGPPPGGRGPGGPGGSGGGGGAQGHVNPGRLSSLTGSLVPLLPFAVKHHATILEIYCEDWLIAFSPKHPLNQRFGADYSRAMKEASANQR